MNYETFKTSAAAAIRQHFGGGAAVSLHPVLKNNNVLLDGLTILTDSKNISPTIYLNYYYEDYLAGKPMTSVVDDIIAAYMKNLPESGMDFSFFTDYGKVREKIIYKVIHYGRNRDLLKDVPHFRYLDLAIVFCCFMPDTPNGNATILIHNSHLVFWNIDADELRKIAIKNTPMLLPCELKSMEDTMKALCPALFEGGLPQTPVSDVPAMFCLSNTARLYGASAMFYPNILSDFAALTGSDLYILPSSIHEVLLLAKDAHSSPSDLNCIIGEVNSSHVPKEEILSDHVYVFERANGMVTSPLSETPAFSPFQP